MLNFSVPYLSPMFSQLLDLRHHLWAAQGYSLPIAHSKKQNKKTHQKSPNKNLLIKMYLSSSTALFASKGLSVPSSHFYIFFIFSVVLP